MEEIYEILKDNEYLKILISMKFDSILKENIELKKEVEKLKLACKPHKRKKRCAQDETLQPLLFSDFNENNDQTL